MANIVWQPQPAQSRFMERSEYEVLYGGAAGGGKSDALVMEATRQVNIPHYKGIILRRTFPQLEELIDKSRRYYPKGFPGARYNDQKHLWIFPSGSKIQFGSMKDEKDMYNYQGFEYDFIGFDELTHFTEKQYMYLMSRNRPKGPGTYVYMRATANPGGIGHGWVKNRFITVTEPMHTVKENVIIIAPDGSQINKSRTRIFVPATIFDNKILLQNDSNYMASLAMLPDAEKRALLYGDWDSFEGQVFTEWRNKESAYDTHEYTHVISPFKIPAHWKIYRGYDYGYSKPFSVGWYAVNEDGCIYRIQEYYGCTGTPNEGVKMEPQAQAKEIKRIENETPMLKGRKIVGIADPAIFDESRGESIARMMEREGVYFSPGDHTRIAGKMQFHNRFAFDECGHAMLYVFNTCKHFIRTIPTLIYDSKHVEDIDSSQEDHIYDECRYVLMEHPIAARKNIPKKKKEFNPLESDNQVKDYSFYRR